MLHLTAHGTSILGTHSAATLGQWGFSASVTSQFYRNPLVIAKSDAVLREIVRDRVDLTTHGAIGVLDWLDLGFDLPVVAYLTAHSCLSASSVHSPIMLLIERSLSTSPSAV